MINEITDHRTPRDPDHDPGGRMVSGDKQMRELEAELAHLRSLFRETLETYRNQVEGELAQLTVPLLESLEENHQKMNLRQQAILKEILVLLRKFKVRPDKGRRKDLKKFQLLIEQVSTLVEQWQWAK